MGTGHAASGAAAWVAVTITADSGFPALGWFPTDAGSVLVGGLVCAGAALLPDADHHNATIAHSVPGAGSVAAGAIGAVTGGHRKGMHSLLAVAGIVWLAYWLATLTVEPSWWGGAPLQVGSAAAVMACVTFAVKVLKVTKSWFMAWLAGATVAAIVLFFAPSEFTWLPVCIGLGYVVHLLGDALTVQGVPFFWPLRINPPRIVSNTPILNKIWLPRGAVAIPLLGNAGSWRETLLFYVLIIYVLGGVGVAATALLQGGW